MIGWFPLPDKGIDVREDRTGAYWRHQERIPDPLGEGPYHDLQAAAEDGEDYAQFVAGDDRVHVNVVE